MPLRRTKRSDGRLRPRWKDGSHVHVEGTNAEQSPRRVTVDDATPKPESLVDVLLLLQRGHESHELTRGRPANAGADARIEESAANVEVRRASLPYGSRFKAPLLLGPRTGVTTNPRGRSACVRCWADQVIRSASSFSRQSTSGASRAVSFHWAGRFWMNAITPSPASGRRPRRARPRASLTEAR